MADIAKYYGQNNPEYFYEYGTADAIATTAWDHSVMHGCVCDSSWKVGYGEGETQLPEYFGADCSLRKNLSSLSRSHVVKIDSNDFRTMSKRG